MDTPIATYFLEVKDQQADCPPSPVEAIDQDLYPSLLSIRGREGNSTQKFQ